MVMRVSFTSFRLTNVTHLVIRRLKAFNHPSLSVKVFQMKLQKQTLLLLQSLQRLQNLVLPESTKLSREKAFFQIGAMHPDGSALILVTSKLLIRLL